MGLTNWIAKTFRISSAKEVRAALGERRSGVTINESTVMGLPTAQACIRLIAECTAMMPMHIYRIEDDGHKTVDYDHPLTRLLNFSPNAEHDAFEFFEMLYANLASHGNFYAEKIIESGRVVSLKPFSWFECSPYRDRRTNRLIYRVNRRLQRQEEIPPDRMFHIRFFRTCGDVGLSPIQSFATNLGLAMAADNTAASTFENGLHVSGVLKTDTVLKDTQRADVKKHIVEPLAGVKKAGGVFLLEAGFDFEKININPIDAQLLESRRFSVEEVARMYRVPLYLVGHPDGDTNLGSGLAQKNTAFLTYTIRPYLTRAIAAIQKQIMEPADYRRYVPGHDVTPLTELDLKTRAEVHKLQINGGVISQNEARREINKAERGGRRIAPAKTDGWTRGENR